MLSNQKSYNDIIKEKTREEQLKYLEQKAVKQHLEIAKTVHKTVDIKLQNNRFRKDDQLLKMKAKLEGMKLKEENQNTKLLRLKNEERKADKLYRQQKRDLQQELAVLAKKTEDFMHNQKIQQKEFQDQESDMLSKEELLKQQYEKMKKFKDDNVQKDIQIAKLKKILDHQLILQKQFDTKKENLQKYEKLLLSVMKYSDRENDEKASDEDQITSLINTYQKIEKNQQDLTEAERKMEEDIKFIKQNLNENRINQKQRILEINGRIPDIQAQTDAVIEKNIKMQTALEQNEDNRQRQKVAKAMIIAAIRNIYEKVKKSQQHRPWKKQQVKTSPRKTQGDENRNTHHNKTMYNDGIQAENMTQELVEKLNFIKETACDLVITNRKWKQQQRDEEEQKYQKYQAHQT